MNNRLNPGDRDARDTHTGNSPPKEARRAIVTTNSTPHLGQVGPAGRRHKMRTATVGPIIITTVWFWKIVNCDVRAKVINMLSSCCLHHEYGRRQDKAMFRRRRDAPTMSHSISLRTAKRQPPE